MPATPAYYIPENYIQTTLEVYGEAGKTWINALPALLNGLEQQWNIHISEPFKLSYNYVAPAVQEDGTEAVLKVGFINNELLSEIAALQAFGGQGIVRLIKSSPEKGAMLLEQITPGMELAEVKDDDAATQIAANVMHNLWIPAPPDPQAVFCQSTLWAKGLDKLRPTFHGTGPFPGRLVDLAEHLFAELFATAGPSMLLHGDLHHWNILSSSRQSWLALDPKGLIGEAEYEVGAWMRNKFPEDGGKSAIKKQATRRFVIFHDTLGFDIKRMLAWTIAQGVLSAWWTYEDHHQIDSSMIFFSEALAEMW